MRLSEKLWASHKLGFKWTVVAIEIWIFASRHPGSATQNTRSTCENALLFHLRYLLLKLACLIIKRNYSYYSWKKNLHINLHINHINTVYKHCILVIGRHRNAQSPHAPVVQMDSGCSVLRFPSLKSEHPWTSHIFCLKYI